MLWHMSYHVNRYYGQSIHIGHTYTNNHPIAVIHEWNERLANSSAVLISYREITETEQKEIENMGIDWRHEVEHSA